VRRTRVALLSLLVLVAGCNDGTSPQVQDRQEARIHQIARAAAELPGVACALGVLATGGLPSAPLGALAVSIRTEGLSEEQERELVREVARRVWQSDLILTQLTVSTRGGTLGIDDAFPGPSGEDELAALAAAFGPRPPLPSPPLPPVEDPGNPPC